MDAIAAQAGLTVGAVYSNSATKDELFLAAFERHCAGELTTLARRCRRAPAWTSWPPWVERFADLDAQHRRW